MYVKQVTELHHLQLYTLILLFIRPIIYTSLTMSLSCSAFYESLSLKGFYKRLCRGNVSSGVTVTINEINRPIQQEENKNASFLSYIR